MKKILLITGFACSLLFACKKNSTTTTQPKPNTNVISTTAISNSKWEIRKSVGGIYGTMNYLPGNRIIIDFFAADSFKITNPMSSVAYKDSGTYTLTPVAPIGTYYLNRTFVNNGNSYSKKDSITVSNNQMIIHPSILGCDMPTDYYEKI